MSMQAVTETFRQAPRTPGRSRNAKPAPVPLAVHPDAELLAKLRSGDESAFAALVRRESGKLLAVARRILRSDDEAQDAVQDGLLSAFDHLDRFEGTAREFRDNDAIRQQYLAL